MPQALRPVILCMVIRIHRWAEGPQSRASDIPPSTPSLRYLLRAHFFLSRRLFSTSFFLNLAHLSFSYITDLLNLHPTCSPSSKMASKDGGQAFAPVLAAVATMQGNVPRSEKAQAHEFLEKFQKSVWQDT